LADSVKVRVSIGLVLIAAITGLLSLDHATGHGWGVIALSAALNAAGLREFGYMAGLGVGQRRGLVLAGACYTLLLGLGYEVDPRLHALLAPLAIGYAYVVFFLCLRGAPTVERFRDLAALALGFFYIPFLGGYALHARFSPAWLGVAPRVGEAAFFFTVAIAKGSDICAYFTGKALGRTKVVPSVSPGKTQAGFVGAVLGGVLVTGLFWRFSSLGEGGLLPLALVPGVGVLLALVGISGDLIESFMKRAVAVKDSAKLLPGYGGILDVVDSVVIAAPAVCLLLWLLTTGRAALGASTG
jgi:phosphatidate cytidylyltransferase